MFDEISPRYDFLNHFLSLGTDIYWRRQFIRKLNITDNTKIIDVACGTGDICFEILKHHEHNGFHKNLMTDPTYSNKSQHL